MKPPVSQARLIASHARALYRSLCPLHRAIMHVYPSYSFPRSFLGGVLIIVQSSFAAPCWARSPIPFNRRESPHCMPPSGPSHCISGSHVRLICVSHRAAMYVRCACASLTPLGGVLIIVQSSFAAPCRAHSPRPFDRRESSHCMLPSGPSHCIAGPPVRLICALLCAARYVCS